MYLSDAIWKHIVHANYQHLHVHTCTVNRYLTTVIVYSITNFLWQLNANPGHSGHVYTHLFMVTYICMQKFVGVHNYRIRLTHACAYMRNMHAKQIRSYVPAS